MTDWIDAWNTTTGEKLPEPVPATWPDVFENISATPTTQPDTAPTKEEDI